MSTQVILLERVEKLGDMGEVVSVRPGYARNYLLPQKKAMRASKENIAYFEAQKSALEKDNADKRSAAEKDAKKLDGAKVSILRQASESGQLFGSVASRDIAEQISEQTKVAVDRSMVKMNQNYKSIGLFPVEIFLHPEVKVEVTINIARNADEAAVQAETGRALTGEQIEEEAPAVVEEDVAAEAEESSEEKAEDAA